MRVLHVEKKQTGKKKKKKKNCISRFPSGRWFGLLHTGSDRSANGASEAAKDKATKKKKKNEKQETR